MDNLFMWRKLKFFLAAVVFGHFAMASEPDSTLQGLESALQSGQYPHIQGAKITVGKRPKNLLLASQTPQKVNKPVDIRSATKSITALLFGTQPKVLTKLALQQPVAETFPELLKNHTATQATLKRQIKVQDLFTMRSGLACDDWQPSSLGNEDKMYQSPNWLSFWGAQPISHQPGKLFSYCTGNVIVLGKLLHKLSGQPVDALAEKTLFKPLSIRHAQWQKTPTGTIDTGGHLKLGLLDLHKIGLLVLNRGSWQGKQLVDADWVKKITQMHAPVPERRETFGMLWWQHRVEHQEQSVPMVYAHGNGGNFIVVMPSLDIVAAFTGDAYNSRQQFVPLRLLAKIVIPQVLSVNRGG